MRRLIAPVVLHALMVLGACAAAGCVSGPSPEPLDPGTAFDGKADGGDPIAYLSDGRARLWPRGKVSVELGAAQAGRLQYALPKGGVDFVAAWIDDAPAFGLPDEASTEMAIFHVHKRADQVGKLLVRGRARLAVKVIRRDVGSTTTSSTFVNRAEPSDFGSITAAADYAIIVAPGKDVSGEGTLDFSGLRFSIE